MLRQSSTSSLSSSVVLLILPKCSMVWTELKLRMSPTSTVLVCLFPPVQLPSLHFIHSLFHTSLLVDLFVFVTLAFFTIFTTHILPLSLFIPSLPILPCSSSPSFSCYYSSSSSSSLSLTPGIFSVTLGWRAADWCMVALDLCMHCSMGEVGSCGVEGWFCGAWCYTVTATRLGGGQSIKFAPPDRALPVVHLACH